MTPNNLLYLRLEWSVRAVQFTSPSSSPWRDSSLSALHFRPNISAHSSGRAQSQDTDLVETKKFLSKKSWNNSIFRTRLAVLMTSIFALGK